MQNKKGKKTGKERKNVKKKFLILKSFQPKLTDNNKQKKKKTQSLKFG